ncbi:hypothetical protein ACLMJK_004256 [Lecanora helva]
MTQIHLSNLDAAIEIGAEPEEVMELAIPSESTNLVETEASPDLLIELLTTDNDGAIIVAPEQDGAISAHPFQFPSHLPSQLHSSSLLQPSLPFGEIATNSVTSTTTEKESSTRKGKGKKRKNHRGSGKKKRNNNNRNEKDNDGILLATQKVSENAQIQEGGQVILDDKRNEDTTDLTSERNLPSYPSSTGDNEAHALPLIIQSLSAQTSELKSFEVKAEDECIILFNDKICPEVQTHPAPVSEIGSKTVFKSEHNPEADASIHSDTEVEDDNNATPSPDAVASTTDVLSGEVSQKTDKENDVKEIELEGPLHNATATPENDNPTLNKKIGDAVADGRNKDHDPTFTTHDILEPRQAEPGSSTPPTAPGTVPSPSPATPPSAPFELKSSPGAGLGLFATAPIPAGTRILTDSALLTLPSPDSFCILPALSALPRYQQKEFFSLSHPTGDEELSAFLTFLDATTPASERCGLSIEQQVAAHGIVWANSFAMSAGKSGIFAQAARINHSCTPNVSHSWNEKLGDLTVHAVRDIGAGEELVTAYVGLCVGREKRNGGEAGLEERYGFRCRCVACVGGKNGRGGKREKRRVKMEVLDKRLEEMTSFVSEGGKCDSGTGFAMAKELVGLVDKEGIRNMELTRCLHQAGQWARLAGKYQESFTFAKRALDATEICTGRDGPYFEEYQRIMRQAERMNNAVSDPRLRGFRGRL